VKTTATRVLQLTQVLLSSAGMKSYFGRSKPVPPRQPLASFPSNLGEFTLYSQRAVPEDQQAVLKSDDSLARIYRGAHGNYAELFIAFYETQRAGESMHSPKNCLPGSGWEPIMNDMISVDPANASAAKVNRYVIEKDGVRALVLYWFQSHGRTIASEYWGKIYLVTDALRTGRRDGAIVRVVVPMGERVGLEKATHEAVAFARATLPQLPAFIPN
jgi:EpsI family protein